MIILHFCVICVDIKQFHTGASYNYSEVDEVNEEYHDEFADMPGFSVYPLLGGRSNAKKVPVDNEVR